MTIQRILVRRGTAAAWTAANPELAAGEPGYETDTGKLKIGLTGVLWNSLPYVTGGGGGADGLGPDGDKGDITVGGAGTTLTIDLDAVSYAKIQNISATDKVLGRATAGAGDIEEITCTAAGRALIDDADATAQRTTLGLVIGTNVQAQDADLSTIAGLTATTDNIIQSVGSAWASRTPTQVKAALAIAESDVTNLTTDLSNKQPLDSDLTTIAGLTATTNNFVQSASSAWASRTPTQATATLDVVTSGAKGLAPASGGGSTNFLRADGTWAVPAGGSADGLGPDGDKGDVTVGGTGTTLTVDNDAITYAKIQNVTATDKVLGRVTAGAGDIEEIACTAAGRALIDDADAAAQRTTLGLVIGTDVQAFDSDLNTIAGLTATTDNMIQSVGSAWASRTPAQVKTALALTVGTNVQAWDADLDQIASLSATTDNIIQSVGSSWSSRTPAQVRAALGLSRQVFNASVSTPAAGFAADTYLVGSSIAIPASSLQAKSIYRCVFQVSKTAAGVAAPVLILRFGTLGTTGDAAKCTFTFPVQTAVADNGLFAVEAIFRTVGSGTSAVIEGTASLIHALVGTTANTNAGLSSTTLGVAPTVSAVSAGFDSTVANSIVGLSVNGGTAAAWTIPHVTSELINIL